MIWPSPNRQVCVGKGDKTRRAGRFVDETGKSEEVGLDDEFQQKFAPFDVAGLDM